MIYANRVKLRLFKAGVVRHTKLAAEAAACAEANPDDTLAQRKAASAAEALREAEARLDDLVKQREALQR